MSAADNDTPMREWARTGGVRFERDVTPLEIARNWAGRVHQIAAYWERREQAEPGFGRIEAEVHGAGRQQFEAAQMASFMATVSIAEDLHRVVAIMTGQVPADLAREAGLDPEQEDT